MASLTPTCYLLLLMAILALQSIEVNSASTKIAYKKPIYGKINTLKDKRAKVLKTTTTATGVTKPAMKSVIPLPIGQQQNQQKPLAAATTTASTPLSAFELPESPPLNSQSSMETTDLSMLGKDPFVRQPKLKVDPMKTASSVKDIRRVALNSSSLLEDLEEDENASLLEEPKNDLDLDALDSNEMNSKELIVKPTTTSTTSTSTSTTTTSTTTESNLPVACTCGIFMQSQFRRGSNEQPLGPPVIVNELDRMFPCNAIGQKQCQTKCLESIVQHLPNSANILCASLDRDCRKERAYLFVKNCRNYWYNTNLAAGREYCCRNGQPYPCPLM